MFREKIKVLDCTIRDGGLINNHDFDENLTAPGLEQSQATSHKS